MHKLIGMFVAACFYYSGLIRFARWWTQHSRKQLIILGVDFFSPLWKNSIVDRGNRL